MEESCGNAYAHCHLPQQTSRLLQLDIPLQLMQSIFSTPPSADLQGGQHGTSNISLDAQVCIGCTIDPEPF